MPYLMVKDFALRMEQIRISALATPINTEEVLDNAIRQDKKNKGHTD